MSDTISLSQLNHRVGRQPKLSSQARLCDLRLGEHHVVLKPLLTGRSVARIIKRAGYATAAAQADLPTHRIMQHTRHKSVEIVNRYIRESDKWTRGGLKGVGF